MVSRADDRRRHTPPPKLVSTGRSCGVGSFGFPLVQCLWRARASPTAWGELDMEMAMSVVKRGQLDVLLWLHTAKNPPAPEWERACEQIAELKSNSHGDISRIRSLVISDGGAPSSTQRSRLFRDIFDQRASKLSLVTPVLVNPIKRGIATAIGWLNPSFRAFDPARWPEALAHIDLADQIEGIWPAFQKLQATLPTIGTLEFIAKDARLEMPPPARASAAGIRV